MNQLSIDVPHALQRAIERREIVPFVGAGVSADVTAIGGMKLFPTWRELLQRAAQRLERQKRAPKARLVTALIEDDEPQYLRAAEEARAALGAEWFALLREVFDPAAEVEPSSLESARLVWAMGSNLVVTTNYDRVLRWACPSDGRDGLREWTLSSAAELAQLATSLPRQHTVWHLHGSIDRIDELVLTPGGYDLLYPPAAVTDPHKQHPHEAALSMLRSLLTGYSFVFLGFSLSDDAFRNQLRWVKDTFKSAGRQHFLLAAAKDADGMRRELNAIQVQVIPFAAHGEPFLGALRDLAGFASQDSSTILVRPSVEKGQPRSAPATTVAADGLLERVQAICRVADGVATVERQSGPDSLGDYLRVVRNIGGICTVGPVATASSVTLETINAFSTVLSSYRALDPAVRGTLVYGAGQVASDVVSSARQKGIDLTSYVKFQGLIDFADYVAQQTEALTSDEAYPPTLFVPQAATLEWLTREQHEEDALAALLRLLHEPGSTLAVVLGDFGVGKSFLSRQLALTLVRESSTLIPIRIDMRQLQKSRSLDALVAQHLATPSIRGYETRKFRHMLADGRVVLIFDGFDELALRVSYAQAAEHLETVCEAALGRAKVIVTSRTQHFASDEQVRTELRKRIDAIEGHAILKLLPFDRPRIQTYLTRVLGDRDAAEHRLALLDDVKDLAGLCANPRMLSFVCEIDESELVAAKERGDQITAAGLYRRLLDRWMQGELTRAGGASTSASDLEAICEHLALKLWSEARSAIPLAEILPSVKAGIAGPALDVEAVLHQTGSGSLLVRDGAGNFSFLHFSLVEWLVANHIAKALRRGDKAASLDAREISALMADFLADLSGGDSAATWARATLGDATTPTAATNALRVVSAMGIDAKLANLAGQDLSGRDLRNGRMRNANLDRAVLEATIFAGSDLTNAKLTDMHAVGADFSHAVLARGDLSGANFALARFVGADLRGCKWDRQTRFTGANLLGARVDPQLKAWAIAAGAAAVGGHDAEPMWIDRLRWSCVAVTVDGLLMAVGSREGPIVLFDLRSGMPIRQCVGHEGEINAVALSADGTRLATGSDDGTVRLWSVVHGHLIHVFTGHTRAVKSVAFSPRADLLASASEDSTARLWDVQTYSQLSVLEHNGWVNSIAFDHDGERVLTGSRDGAVVLWGAKTARPLFALPSEQGRVSAVALSRDSKVAAVATASGRATLWNLESGTAEYTVRADMGRITGVAFNLDGQSLAVAGRGVCIVDIPSGRERIIEPIGVEVDHVAFSRDGKTVVGVSGGNLRAWNLSSGGQIQVLQGSTRTSSVSHLSFGADGRTLATVTDGGDLRLWNRHTGRARVVPVRGGVSAVAFTPDGREVVAGTLDGRLCVIDVASGDVTVEISCCSRVTGLAFNGRNRRLAVAGRDVAVQLWDIATGREVRSFNEFGEDIEHVSVSADGRWIVGGPARAPWVAVWDFEANAIVARLECPAAPVALSVSPTGDRIAIASGDRAYVYEMESWRRMAELATTPWGNALSLAFDSGGTSLAVGSTANRVHIFSLQTMRQVAVLEGHRGHVGDVGFSHDGKWVASASRDGSCRLWNPSGRGSELALLHPHGGWATVRGRKHLAEHAAESEFWYVSGVCRVSATEASSYLDLGLEPSEAQW